MKAQVSKDSLFNYFAGRATAWQKQAIEDWAKDHHNREVFFECLADWESQNPQFIADDRQALIRHQQRVLDRSDNERVTSTKLKTSRTKPNWFGWMMAASVSLIVIMMSVSIKNHLFYTTYKTNFGETRTVILTDGSRVTLNANSCLRVPRFNFGKQTREVVLVGEANFSVKHLLNHQHFVVHTDKNFDVVVLGTEFLVNAREEGRKVVLSRGKVRLLYQEGSTSKQLLMKPGNLVTFDHRGRVSLAQTLKPQDFISWKDHRFVFDGTTLAEIRTLFAQNYGIKLQIPDKELAHWTISGAFTAHSAEELIETIASASDLAYQQQGDTIIITQSHELTKP